MHSSAGKGGFAGLELQIAAVVLLFLATLVSESTMSGIGLTSGQSRQHQFTGRHRAHAALKQAEQQLFESENPCPNLSESLPRGLPDAAAALDGHVKIACSGYACAHAAGSVGF